MDTLVELKRLKVETGSLACLGCGHEHGCDVHGCAILREAAEEITRTREERDEYRNRMTGYMRFLGISDVNLGYPVGGFVRIDVSELEDET